MHVIKKKFSKIKKGLDKKFPLLFSRPFQFLYAIIILWLFFSSLLYLFPNNIIFITQYSQGTPRSSEVFEDIYVDYGDSQRLYLAQSLNKKSDDKVVLFFHGNGGMIGRIIDALAPHYNLVVPAYPGYHFSTGKPSEEKLYEVAELSVDYLKNIGFKEENIIIFGASLGGTPALYAAKKYPNVKTAIVVATFDKMASVCYDIYHVFCIFAGDMFNNVGIAQDIKNTRIRSFHSVDDEMIGFDLGRNLFDNIASKNKKFYQISGGHNNFKAVDIIEKSLKD